MSSVLFLVLGASGYLIASVLYGAYLLQSLPARQTTFLHSGRVAGVLGVLFHTTSIGLFCIHTHHTPISTGPEAFSATGWAIALVFIGLEAVNWKKPPSVIGAIAFPLAFLSVFTGSTLGAPKESLSTGHTQVLNSSLVGLHILAIVFAFGLLTLAGICSLLYLVEHRLLKQKRFIAGPLAKLPPLATVDHLAFSLVALAFPLLTLGIVAGIIRAASSAAPFIQWATDVPTLASILCWGVYSLYLWAHATSNWQGIRANYLLLGALIVALVTFFAPSTLHRFS